MSTIEEVPETEFNQMFFNTANLRYVNVWEHFGGGSSLLGGTDWGEAFWDGFIFQRVL